MSEENIEIVRRVYDAFNRDDWEGAFRDAHPNVEITFQRGPIAGTHQGREKLQSLILDLRAGFDAWSMEPSEFLDRGDQVVAIVKSRLRPKGTSAELELRNGHVWTIGDGTILSLVGFPNPEDALEAAGLRR